MEDPSNYWQSKIVGFKFDDDPDFNSGSYLDSAEYFSLDKHTEINSLSARRWSSAKSEVAQKSARVNVSAQRCYSCTNLCETEEERYFFDGRLLCVSCFKDKQRQAEEAPESKVVPEVTVTNIILHRPYNLAHSFYRTLEGKRALLTTVVEMADGNAILVVIDFLQATLSSRLLTAELKLDVSGVAMKHYLILLKQQARWDEYMRVLSEQGRHQERLMVQYLRETSFLTGAKSDPLIDERRRMNSIQNFAENHLSENSIKELKELVMEQSKLICQQLFLEERDCDPKYAAIIFASVPREIQLVRQTVLNTLYYLCLYHWKTLDSASSPLNFKMTFRLSEQQFVWTLVRALCRQRERWDTLSAVLTTRNLIGKDKPLEWPYERLIKVLHQGKAPYEILIFYLERVSDRERRLELAVHVGCIPYAVEMCRALRDRNTLLSIQKQLPMQDPVQQTVSAVLADRSVKWR